jgi:hypothetical protein
VLGLRSLPEFASQLHATKQTCSSYVLERLMKLERAWSAKTSRVGLDHPARQNLEQCMERLGRKQRS